MIRVAKKIGLATSAALWAIVLRSSSAEGSSSLFLRMVSIITMVPSTMIPKSMAPSDSRLAGMSVSHMRINAISSDRGMVTVASRALLGLPRKIINMASTSRIPKERVCTMV